MVQGRRILRGVLRTALRHRRHRTAVHDTGRCVPPVALLQTTLENMFHRLLNFVHLPVCTVEYHCGHQLGHVRAADPAQSRGPQQDVHRCPELGRVWGRGRGGAEGGG